MAYKKFIELPTYQDSRGGLTVMEKILPFDIERTYWIHSADGQIRGGHRHRHTRQALIAVSGVVELYMSNGESEETILLNRPSQCIIVEPEDWHTMKFSKNAVLLVMSSHVYDRSEYIDTPYGV
jgi:dTDP-4-dehydrorhamnose 3,5-epimerase-like enzyme